METINEMPAPEAPTTRPTNPFNPKGRKTHKAVWIGLAIVGGLAAIGAATGDDEATGAPANAPSWVTDDNALTVQHRTTWVEESTRLVERANDELQAGDVDGALVAVDRVLDHLASGEPLPVSLPFADECNAADRASVKAWTRSREALQAMDADGMGEAVTLMNVAVDLTDTCTTAMYDAVDELS